MKITFITGHLCKERHSLLYELAVDLGKMGAQVTVLSGYPSRRISDDVRLYYLQHQIECIGKNVIVKRIGSRKGEGNTLFMRMVKYVNLTINLYLAALKEETDVFYIYSSPPFLGIIGTMLSKKKAPTLYNAQDLFPDTLIRIKGLSEINPLIRILRKVEKKVYNGNNHIVTISDEMKNTILSSGGEAQKVSVIKNWADIDNLHYVKRSNNNLFTELQIDPKKFIISYAGDIGLFQGWSVILDAAIELEQLNPDIEFVIIGNGSYRNRMERRIQEDKIKNVYLYPMQSSERLSEIYSIGNLELLPLERGITKMAMPSKVGVIMAVGNPVLALVDQNSNLASDIKKYKLGITLEHNDSHALVTAILHCYEEKMLLPSMEKNVRAYAEQNYNRQKQTSQYYYILDFLARESSDLGHKK